MTSRIDSPDTQADRELRDVLDQDRLTGFTMVAGAGSGKTTSLVKALAHVTRTRGPSLLAKTQRVACITYTEVAAREIHAEIGNDSLALVSTIHSFLWSLAKPFQKDIGAWVSCRIDEAIAELLAKQGAYTSRTQSATKEKDTADLKKRRHQQAAVKTVTRWTYGVAGNYSLGVLGHADVLKMVPEMIRERDLLARLVARQFPFIFVDESQDTFPAVVECLKRVWVLAEGKMCLGFFGDPMQQIYQQGVGPVSREPGWRNIDKRRTSGPLDEFWPVSMRCVLRAIHLSRFRGLERGSPRARLSVLSSHPTITEVRIWSECAPGSTSTVRPATGHAVRRKAAPKCS